MIQYRIDAAESKPPGNMAAPLLPDAFMNTSLVFNPIAARTIPYSAAGTGVAFLREGAPLFSFVAFDPQERATIGLEDLYARGVVLMPDFSLRVKPLGRPGTYNFGGTYSNGGRSMFRGRTLDTFGVGFFYLGLSDNFKTLAAPFVPQQNEYGVELFYNYAVRPWCRLTTDMQVAEPSTVGFDTAIM